jgi:hypothetical protein
MQNKPDEEKQLARKALLWMAACCVPMIAIIILIALGYWGFR